MNVYDAQMLQHHNRINGVLCANAEILESRRWANSNQVSTALFSLHLLY